jgi:hypothetical protein
VVAIPNIRNRRTARWRLVGVAVAALLDLATPTASTAQYTAPGTVVAPGADAAVRPAASPGSPWSFLDRVQIDLGYMYDDNVTRGRAADEILADQLLALNVSAGATLRINVSHLRDGGHFALGVNAQSAVSDRIAVSGEFAWNRRSAQSEVWDLDYYSARLNLDYSLGRSGTFYLNGEYRRGDSVSDGRPSLVNVSLAQVFVLDDAFPGKQLYAYRYDARTWVATIGYNVPLNSQASIDVSWRRAQATPTSRPDFDVQGSLRYVDNQYSLFLLMVF